MQRLSKIIFLFYGELVKASLVSLYANLFLASSFLSLSLAFTLFLFFYLLSSFFFLSFFIIHYLCPPPPFNALPFLHIWLPYILIKVPSTCVRQIPYRKVIKRGKGGRKSRIMTKMIIEKNRHVTYSSKRTSLYSHFGKGKTTPEKKHLKRKHSWIYNLPFFRKGFAHA